MPYLKNHFYHVYNRGCNREPIFFTSDNYIFLLQKMKKTVEDYGVGVIGYCLMPNHYHFLLQQKTIRSLSDWIRVLFNGYTQAVNRQQKRKGTLFEGRAQHRVITEDNYLMYLLCYIHLNPVETGLVSRPGEWEFSNYLECVGRRRGQLYDRRFITNYFGSYSEYKEFFENWSLNTSKMRELNDFAF